MVGPEKGGYAAIKASKNPNAAAKVRDVRSSRKKANYGDYSDSEKSLESREERAGNKRRRQQKKRVVDSDGDYVEDIEMRENDSDSLHS